MRCAFCTGCVLNVLVVYAKCVQDVCDRQRLAVGHVLRRCQQVELLWESDRKAIHDTGCCRLTSSATLMGRQGTKRFNGSQVHSRYSWRMPMVTCRL